MSEDEDNFNIQGMLEAAMRFKVCEARRQAGLSEAELAEICGWPTEKILSLEKGKRPITPSELAVILDACRYFPDDSQKTK